MKKYSGRIEYRDLEGGSWILVSGAGTFVLRGSVAKDLDGAQVEVEGEESGDASMFMAGPVLAVKKIRRS